MWHKPETEIVRLQKKTYLLKHAGRTSKGPPLFWKWNVTISRLYCTTVQQPVGKVQTLQTTGDYFSNSQQPLQPPTNRLEDAHFSQQLVIVRQLLSPLFPMNLQQPEVSSPAGHCEECSFKRDRSPQNKKNFFPSGLCLDCFVSCHFFRHFGFQMTCLLFNIVEQHSTCLLLFEEEKPSKNVSLQK